VTVVKLAGYNDYHFLLPMLKAALLIEFNQQWLRMEISLDQSLSLSALSVRFSSGLSPLFKLFSVLVCLLACSPFSCILRSFSRISERAPMILFCFNKAFCCLRLLAGKEMKPVFFCRRANFVHAFFYLCVCTFSPMCS